MEADSFEELREDLGRIAQKISEQTEQQRRQQNDTKNGLQHATEYIYRNSVQTQAVQFRWVCLVALIALASAELWVGVVGVALILGLTSWGKRHVRRVAFRFDRFRLRYRKLLERVDHMLAEDKEFLRKYEDSILYPLAVPEHKRAAVSSGNLYHVETLYREYCGVHNSYSKDFTLCTSGLRDRLKSASSRFEAAIESARQKLITQIDGKNPQGAVDAKGILQLFDDDSLLKTLRGKEWWTFEEADKMRDLMSSDKVMGWRTHREKLSGEMEIASEKNGVEDTWRFYSAAKDWRGWSGFEVPSKSSFHRMQRIINRHNPEAMLRELRLYQFDGLKELKDMGFDSGITEKELSAANKLMRRERGKLGKVFDKEVEAAQFIAQNAEIASELTNWEVDKARGMGFLQRALGYSGGGGDPCQ